MRNKWLKKLNKKFTLRKILADEGKSLSKEKKEKIRNELGLLDVEILELERELKSKIPGGLNEKNHA